jgi:dUTP pyrophosphatase
MSILDEKTVEELKVLLEKLKEESGVDSTENYSEIVDSIMDSEWDEMEQDLYNQMQIQVVKVKKLNDDAVIPSYNYPSDSGFDLHSTESVEIPSLGRVLVPTGLSFQFEMGYELQVRPKSGLALKMGLTVLNTPGTIDQGYSGEVKVIVFNSTLSPVKIEKGMKIAQGVICPVLNGKFVKLIETEEFEEQDRGDNGFGSTGIK